MSEPQSNEDVAKQIAECEDLVYTDLVFNGEGYHGEDRIDRVWLADMIVRALNAAEDRTLERAAWLADELRRRVGAYEDGHIGGALDVGAAIRALKKPRV